MNTLAGFITQEWALWAAFFAILALLIGLELKEYLFGPSKLSPQQATQLINRENAVVLDVRESNSFQKGHIIDAQPLTAQEIRAASKKMEKLKSRPVIVVCDAGLESQKIAAYLIKQGYNAHSLRGGLRNWRDAQLPLVKE